MRPSRRRLSLALVLLLGPMLAGAQAGSPLTLPEAIAWAVNHNPKTAAATARVQQAEARVQAAAAPAQPAFKLSGSGRLQGPVQEISIPVVPGRSVAITRSEHATVALGVVWPLWTGGRVEAATGAARAQVSAAEADLQQAVEQLIYEVGLAYFRVLSTRSRLDDARAGLSLAEESLRTARALRDAGALIGAELAQAEAAHRQAQQQLSAAANAATDAEQTLNTLLVRPLGEPVVLTQTALELQCPADPDEAQAVAQAVRPELLALASRQEAAEQAIALARAERNPTVAAVGQVAWQTPTDVMESHAEFFGVEFSWPILHHPASRAGERGTRASVREVEEVRRDLESAIRLQVGESGRRLADAEEVVAATAEALRAAREADRQAAVAYDAGTTTRRAREVARAAAHQAEAAATQAEHARSATHLSRARALGLLRTLFLIPPQEPEGR
ncbi:MAG: TolC family protein [Armatimonadetes bacterium]|nr:TolC family protein [Armatimonadota bacterium]